MAAHRLDECVPIDELRATARAYALLALDWCGLGSRPDDGDAGQR
jgi:hypothetical protein